jgi:hypothetical protein
MRSISVWGVTEKNLSRRMQQRGKDEAGYRAIAPLYLLLQRRLRFQSGKSRPGLLHSSATRATTLVIIGAHGNGLQLRPFDQAQRNAHIVKPFLQFAVHITPPSGKCRQPTSGPLNADHSAKSHFTPATECRGKNFFLRLFEDISNRHSLRNYPTNGGSFTCRFQPETAGASVRPSWAWLRRANR